ncbi:galactose-3-O-sulfotransferase 2-like isoform X2 [Branchiostoma floridae]|uniref:Galactose-3-O-sulfotransferase 2-like isoform X2 n=1 Tax=Branchiostoma floridae TaxID=7739 RepID=A0A9J7LD94_BRAFL|nr:galactose-3-O-sulfotransferase 2-like isoform X2 [Branchiostoma floridae]
MMSILYCYRIEETSAMLLRKAFSGGLVVGGTMLSLLLIMVHQLYQPSTFSQGYTSTQPDTLQAGVSNMIHREEQQLRMSTRQEEVTTSRFCIPQKKFVFIKTHKTGTCTTINIFQRYAIYNKLEVLMPVSQGPLSWPFPPEEADYIHTPDGTYDALMHHFVYNKTWLLTKFPPETPYISIIRDPFHHLKSQMNYYHLPMILGIEDSKDAVKTFLKDPWRYRNKSEVFFDHVNVTWDGTRNPLSFDLGWPAEKADKEEEASIYITQLDKEFTLVMILEHLDESVVMLRRLMCWEIRDVVYFLRIENKRYYAFKRYEATPEELDNHRRWSAVDYMLYDTFNKSLWRKIAAQGPDFFDELQYFRRIRVEVSHHCTEMMNTHKNETLTVKESRWSPEFDVDYTYCSYIYSKRVRRLDEVMRGYRITRKELDHSVMDTVINVLLKHKGFPTFKNIQDAHAAGIVGMHTHKIRAVGKYQYR